MFFRTVAPQAIQRALATALAQPQKLQITAPPAETDFAREHPFAKEQIYVTTFQPTKNPSFFTQSRRAFTRSRAAPTPAEGLVVPPSGGVRPTASTPTDSAAVSLDVLRKRMERLIAIDASILVANTFESTTVELDERIRLMSYEEIEGFITF